MSFDKKVWAACKKIPSGKVSTYKELAHSFGSKAYRAVGAALKNNKYPDLIPCFRVIKSDGRIGGYFGSDPKNVKKKVEKLKAEGIVIINERIDLERYFFDFRD